MKHLPKILLPLLLCLAPFAAAQQPEGELRFDQAQREEIADLPASNPTDSLKPGRPAVCKLNRKRVSFAAAYDAVTLWNVKKARVKNRRMKLSDTTRREKVLLLKFFIERDSKKGARPHLLGNVGGCMWSDHLSDPVTGNWGRTVPTHLSDYTLKNEMDSVRKASAEPLRKVPDHMWRRLSHEAVYVLDGKLVPGSAFFFAEGLFLQTLDVCTDPDTMAHYNTDKGVVIGKLYPGRLPLVVYNGKPSTIGTWLEMCRSGAFSMSASVAMRYFYMLPAEAVETYGKAGKYGAICIGFAL